MINTTLCYIEQEGKYLLLHRVKKKNDINKDKWIGIGGKFEEGESPEDCIRRETMEETGLTLIHPKYRGIVTFISDGMQETEFILIRCFLNRSRPSDDVSVGIFTLFPLIEFITFRCMNAGRSTCHIVGSILCFILTETFIN